jgi:predicted nucleic acid-binding protein
MGSDLGCPGQKLPVCAIPSCGSWGASAIALAAENQSSLLIIDDLKGRKLAKKFKLSITGTLGLILIAKREGIIPLIKPVFDKILATNFRIAPMLLESILKEAGE